MHETGHFVQGALLIALKMKQHAAHTTYRYIDDELKLASEREECALESSQLSHLKRQHNFCTNLSYDRSILAACANISCARAAI